MSKKSPFQVTSVSKKLGQSTVVYYYCTMSHFFETDVIETFLCFSLKRYVSDMKVTEEVKGNCVRFSTVHEHKCSFFSHKTTPGPMMTAITIREIQEVMRRNHCLANKG